jgi:hypothetical protein
MANARFIRKRLANMSPAQRAALVMLAEEGAELTQAATKALRFGLHKFNPYNVEAGDNLTQLANEACDVVEAMNRFFATLSPRDREKLDWSTAAAATSPPERPR